MSDQLLPRVPSSGGGDSFDQEVTDDDFLLSLLSDEIQDDQINDITEGLELQEAIHSSLWMISDDSHGSGATNHDVNSADAGDEYLLSLLSDEIQDDQSNVITDGLQMQRAIHSSCVNGDDSDRRGATNDDVSSVSSDEKKFHGISLAYAGDEIPPEEDDQTDWDQNNSSVSICESCDGQKKRDDEMVRVHECGHYFCEFCLNKHISAKVDSGERLINCPAEKCPNFLQYDYCVATMLKYMLDKRGKLFPESMIPDSKSIPCPYKDCESGILKENLEGLKEIECLACHRFVCVKCYAPLHADVECDEFQRNSRDERGWQELLNMEALGSLKPAD